MYSACICQPGPKQEIPPRRISGRAAACIDFARNNTQTMKLDGCSAVITGASAGIGRELARQLGRRAKLLVVVARRRDRLEQLRTELLAGNPAFRVEIRQTDLSNLEQTMQLAALLQNAPVDLLSN